MLDIYALAEGVSAAARNFPVKKRDLFGSYARSDQASTSDIDLLVEFTSLAVSLLTISSLRAKIEEKLGVSVDLGHAPLPEDSFLEIGETVTIYER